MSQFIVLFCWVITESCTLLLVKLSIEIRTDNYLNSIIHAANDFRLARRFIKMATPTRQHFSLQTDDLIKLKLCLNVCKCKATTGLQHRASKNIFSPNMTRKRCDQQELFRAHRPQMSLAAGTKHHSWLDEAPHVGLVRSSWIRHYVPGPQLHMLRAWSLLYARGLLWR